MQDGISFSIDDHAPTIEEEVSFVGILRKVPNLALRIGQEVTAELLVTFLLEHSILVVSFINVNDPVLLRKVWARWISTVVTIVVNVSDKPGQVLSDNVEILVR